MTLGGVLVPNASLDYFRNLLAEIADTFGKKELHCKNLKHLQKVHFAQTMAARPIVCFGLISHKITLGKYTENIEAESTKFYNKCAIYLLECVGEYLNESEIKPEDLDIVFEEGPFNYTALSNFVKVCQRRPMNPRARLLKYVDADNVRSVPKADEVMLQISDLVAHALYSCVDRSKGKYHVTEPRYLNELRSRFYHDSASGKVVGKGLKAIHDLKKLELDEDIFDFLDELSSIN